MNILRNRPMWLAALAAGAMLSSCTSEIEQGGLNGDAALADGTVRFVMSLPSGGKVLYPTRMIQEEEEYAVKRLDVWEYNVKADGTKEFLRVHPGVKFSPTTEATQYEGAIEIRKDEAGENHQFYFVANTNVPQGWEWGDTEDSQYDVVFDTGDGLGFCSSKVLDINSVASDLLENGVEMSGVAVSGSMDSNNRDITLPASGTMQCFVPLTRIVARVDLYSNAPNLVITGATMYDLNTSGAYFIDGENQSLVGSAAADNKVPDYGNISPLGINAMYSQGGLEALPTQFTTEDQQRQQWTEVYDTEHGVRKAFYCYEKSNVLASNPSYIVVDYTLEGGITGKVTVPFTNTDESGNLTPVNIVRNNLYRVVLGDGDPIRPGADVEVKIIDEPWEVIDLPVVVGKPEQGETVLTQAEANAALNVNKFARTPVANKLPEGCNLMDAIESNLLMFADDSLEPYEVSTSGSEYIWCTNNRWTTRIDGELYRIPTVVELADLLPPYSSASVVGSSDEYRVSRLRMNASNSISGQETSCYFFHSELEETAPIFTMYILTGLIDKSATGGSVIDCSDTQAKIQRLNFDSNNNVYTMDVMALRTMDLSSVFNVDNSGNMTYLNMSRLAYIFQSGEDMLTFRFNKLSSYTDSSVEFRTLSQNNEDTSSYNVRIFADSGSPATDGNVNDTPIFNNYGLMLIKAD